MQAPADTAAQQTHFEAGHIDRMLVCSVTAANRNDSRVEPLILERYLSGRVKSADIQFSPRIISFPRILHTSRRSIRLAQDGADVLEIDLAAITQSPCGIQKIGDADVRVNLAVRNFPLELRHGK